MRWLSDQVVGRLQNEVQWPELEGTRYRALKFLGRGGMGGVWLAEDLVLHRQVALKVLAVEQAAPEMASRLLREAEVLAQLEHPGIVPVHDAGTLADGRSFYCMKLVQGQTLEEAMGGLTLRARLQLLQRIAEPLALAHSRGIIHRDLKPANIMIGPFGEVLIMDWGLARIRVQPVSGPAPPPPSGEGGDVRPGPIMGTAGFMAPEQLRGDEAQMDQRTDVFGLGALLRCLLDLPDSEKPPRALAAICAKAMSPDMADRYATAESMSADIGRYLEGLPVSAYRENPLERAERLIKRHQVAVVLVLVYLLMRALFVLFSRGS